MNTFDLVVIGGGSGGVRAARIAANHGARVALVEAYRLGGTCVIRGCVPKKLMVYASRFAQEFEEAAGYGWAVGPARFDWATLKTRRDAEVTRLEGLYRGNLERAGVVLFEGHAQLLDSHTVQVSGAPGKPALQLAARRVLLATGAQPSPGPAIEGHDLAIDSNGFFDLPALPRRVVVQGAGYIALELACVLQRLGAEVSVVVRGPHILRGFDHELRNHLAAEIAASGVQFIHHHHVSAIHRASSGALQVQLNGGQQLETDCVLRALGRTPNTHGLGLQAAGVERDGNGAIKVDAHSQTSVPHIHAVGDVTNRVNLTPMAIREGHAYADAVFGHKPTAVDHTLVPTAVFTTPEAGTVGLTEEQALQQHPRLDVYRALFRPMKATLSGHSGKMLLKLLVDRDTDRVLGFHGVGPDTGEMAQLMGVVLRLGATKTAMDATLAVHPTAAEELVTMRTPAVQHGL